MSNALPEGAPLTWNPEDTELNAEHIGAALRTRWLGRPCYSLQETASTNAVLAERAAAGAPAGTLVLAEYQSAGRGRQGRRWLAPPGSSLLFSTLFRPPWPAARAAWLTMIAGLASVQAVREVAGLHAALKWPNDVMVLVEEQWRKAGGILLETALDGETIRHAIVGIGLNVNVARRQLPEAPTPATSLLLAGGQAVARLPLLSTLLLRLEEAYEPAAAGQSPQPAWDELLVTRGRPVTVHGEGIVLAGMATGTDEWGRLLVRDATGAIHAVSAGDVTLREESR